MVTSVTAEASVDASAQAVEPPWTARRYGVLALVLAVVVGLVLGYAGGLLTPGLRTPGDTSPEAGFARDMTSHHTQAVEMGLIAFDSATDPGVRQIAVDIAIAQQGEIGTMQTWLRSWGLDPTGSQPPMAWMSDGAESVTNGLMPGMATPEQMAKLQNASGTELDVLFLELMIDHHLGGIHMADAVVKMTDDEEILAVAATMKRTQQSELTNLGNLLDRIKAEG